jgi:hypothetical protein
MKNFFRRLQPEKPVLRNNYFIQVDDKLAWSESIGSEDSEGIGWFTVRALILHSFPLYARKGKGKDADAGVYCV